MYPDVKTLMALLVKEKYISEADGRAAQAASHDSASYIAYLVDNQLLNKPLLGQALAESYGLRFVDLQASPITKDLVEKIPEALARENRVVCVQVTADTIYLVSDSPKHIKPKDIQPLFPDQRLRLRYTLPESIDACFLMYAQTLETRFSKIIDTGHRVAPEIVYEIIKDALRYRASDIHFEPHEDMVNIRFRIDGGLREAGKIPKEYYDNVLNRVKVESGMRIDEHLAAQDGSLRHNSDDGHADLRVSLVPTIEGEKIVMRVLNSYVQDYTLDDIGLSDEHRQKIEKAARSPFGMILTVGPTGSGKTTTLYATLKTLNKPDINITTIEDPVEYRMSGITQIQVREQSNMTFSRGLRAIVRQDPDVILVGEIRDQETAEIAVNAALTGHLLLSTFHANNAAAAIPRLVEMGIEPFLLSSTLEIIIAQRLVRTICSQCRYSVPASQVLAELPTGTASLTKYFSKTDNLYLGKGCQICSNTGYNGRTAVYECIEVTPALQELISRSGAAHEIEQLARAEGEASMFEDGLAKVKAGITTLSEVARVVELPQVKKVKK